MAQGNGVTKGHKACKAYGARPQLWVSGLSVRPLLPTPICFSSYVTIQWNGILGSIYNLQISLISGREAENKL